MISLQLVEDFALKDLQFEWDRDDGRNKQGKQESWACGRDLPTQRSEPTPAFVETHDDIAVQIENKNAPEKAEGDGRRSGLKHGPECIAAGETRQDGGQDNRRTDPSIGIMFGGAVPRAQNRHIGSRTKPEEPLQAVRSGQRDRWERTHMYGALWSHRSTFRDGSVIWSKCSWTSRITFCVLDEVLRCVGAASTAPAPERALPHPSSRDQPARSR